jgi:hypothetical protein
MLAAQIAPLCALRHIAIFQQGRSLLRASSAQIKAHQGLGSDRLAPGHELVGAKLIGVERIPRLVEHPGTVLPGANPIEPVVSRNKISAGIADDGNFPLAHFVHHILA